MPCRNLEGAGGDVEEEMENREANNLSIVVKWKTHRLGFIAGDFNNIEGLGFHGDKLNKM